MQELFTKTAYAMTPRETVSFEARRGEVLHAVDGRLWVTRVGDLRDYWLLPGERLELKAGERIWISAEADESLRVELLRPARRWAGWRRVLTVDHRKPPVRVMQ